MRYYLDEDLSQRVAVILRQQGFDATSSHEEGRNHLPDHEQLGWAAEQGRCMVTRNRDDFIDLTVQAFAHREPHAGLLIVPFSLRNNQFNLIAGRLADYARAHPEGMQPYTIDYL